MYVCMDVCMCVYTYMDVCMCVCACMHACMHATDGWMAGRTDGWMDGWKDACTARMHSCTYIMNIHNVTYPDMHSLIQWHPFLLAILVDFLSALF